MHKDIIEVQLVYTHTHREDIRIFPSNQRSIHSESQDKGSEARAFDWASVQQANLIRFGGRGTKANSPCKGGKEGI